MEKLHEASFTFLRYEVLLHAMESSSGMKYGNNVIRMKVQSSFFFFLLHFIYSCAVYRCARVLPT